MRNWVRGIGMAALASPMGAWAQCALCRTALTQSPEGQRMAAGFNAGIIFLFAAPFVIGGGIAVYLFRAPLGAWWSARRVRGSDYVAAVLER